MPMWRHGWNLIIFSKYDCSNCCCLCRNQSFIRQIIFLIPGILIFGYIGGVEGILWATPVAEIANVKFPILCYNLNKYKQEKGGGANGCCGIQ